MTWPPSRRAIGWTLSLVALALIAPPLLVVGLFVGERALSRWRERAEHARTHTTLDRPMTVDGAVLPAGAEVAWEDRTRSRVSGARLHQPADILGVRTSYLYRDGDGGWIIYAQEPRELDGWPCAEGHTHVAATGKLHGCAISRAMSWCGWTLPERTVVHLLPFVHAVQLSLPYVTMLDMPLVSPVLGELPPFLVLNDDGSPSSASYHRGAPYRAAGRELTGEVRWKYDPATYGMGRERQPVTVSGFVHVPEGAGGADVQRPIVLPWPGPSAQGREEAQ